MKPGDKVRLLHDKEEGIISRIIDHTQVEIVTTDGFAIPVLRKELVVIASEEESLMLRGHNLLNKTTAATKTGGGMTNQQKKELAARLGLFLALEPIGGNRVQLMLINNTTGLWLCTAGFLEKGHYENLFGGSLEPQKIWKGSIYEMNKVPDFTFSLRWMLYDNKAAKLPDTFEVMVKFKPKSLQQKPAAAPVLERPAYLAHIDTKQATQLFKTPPPPLPVEKPDPRLNKPEIAPPDEVVDLHIEKLTENSRDLSGQDMFRLQMSVFKDSLERAIACRLPTITFIHGLGGGVLKNNLWQQLQQHPQVDDVHEGSPLKFGKGAVKAILKR